MKFLNKLERKYGRYGVENLMLIVCAGQIMVYIADLVTDGAIYNMLYLNWAAVKAGQIWRLVTFIFIPEGSNIIYFILGCYFYYMIGGALENEWGTFNFNCYYYLGMICCIVAAIICGYGSNTYINQSMFFAFALLYPNYTLLLFYVIPVKVKWIALFEAALYLFEFIVYPSDRWTIGLSLVPLFVFFWDSGRAAVRRTVFTIKNRARYRNNWK